MNPLLIGAVGFAIVLALLYVASRETPHKPKDWRVLWEDRPKK